MKDKIQTTIRTFLVDATQHQELQNDDNIFEQGFVNSLFAMQIVMFVEQEFDLTVENEDLVLENFQSIDALTALVLSKTSAKELA